MTLTTGEVGLIAVGATLVGTFGTMIFAERHYQSERKARWFKDRREVYVNFLMIASKIHETIEDIADEIIKNGGTVSREDSFFGREEYETYEKLTEAAKKPMTEIRLLGSPQIIALMRRLVNSENIILKFHPMFNKKPGKVSKARMTKLKRSYNDSYSSFIAEARKELDITFSLKELKKPSRRGLF